MTAPATDSRAWSLLDQVLPAGAAFDEVRVGMRWTGPETAPGHVGGVRPVAALLGMLPDAVPCTGAELVGLECSEQRPADSSSPVRLVATITRRGPAGDGAGRLVSDLRIVDGRHAALVGGRATWRIPGARPADPDPVRLALEFGSVAWGKRIAERLAANENFRSTTTPFDGAIGFSSGPDEVNLRIYRGSIVEVARKAVDGPTFTIDATELTWLELLTAPANDYFRRTMSGAFTVRGNGFQYVRMIKAIMLIVDEARAEVSEVLDA